MNNTEQYFPNATNENRIIARFMGKNYHEKLDKTTFINELQYHSDWRWLMKVIEKIAKIEYDDAPKGELQDTSYPRTFGMIAEDGEFMFRFNRYSLFKAPTLIDAAYKAVVDFIQSEKD